MSDPVEVVTLRMRAIGVLPRPIMAKIESGNGDIASARRGERQVYVPALRKWTTYIVYDRMKLRASDEISGPAIVEEPSSTALIHAGETLRVGEYGEMVIQIGPS